jgi:hypothetical protein
MRRCAKLLIFMAGPTRLELATSCVTGRRSNRLNYGPVWLIILPLAQPSAKSAAVRRSSAHIIEERGRSVNRFRRQNRRPVTAGHGFLRVFELNRRKFTEARAEQSGRHRWMRLETARRARALIGRGGVANRQGRVFLLEKGIDLAHQFEKCVRILFYRRLLAKPHPMFAGRVGRPHAFRFNRFMAANLFDCFPGNLLKMSFRHNVSRFPNWAPSTVTNPTAYGLNL